MALPNWKVAHGRVPSSHAKNGVGKKALVEGDTSALGDSSKILDGFDRGQFTARALKTLLVVQGSKVCPEEHEAFVPCRVPVKETASSGKEAGQAQPRFDRRFE
jgi:hypothetical protein